MNPKYNGNFEKALRSITARALVVPRSTDLFFPPEDNAYEVEHMLNAVFHPIESKWGHCFGIGQNEQDSIQIDKLIKQFLLEELQEGQ